MSGIPVQKGCQRKIGITITSVYPDMHSQVNQDRAVPYPGIIPIGLKCKGVNFYQTVNRKTNYRLQSLPDFHTLF